MAPNNESKTIPYKDALRASDLLDQSQREVPTKYLEDLRAVMKDLAARQRRSAFRALVTIVAFTFIELAVVGPKVQAGAFEFTNLAFIQKCLPTVFAYYMYDNAMLADHFFIAWDLHEMLMKIHYPGIYSAGVDRLIVPYPLSLYGPLALPPVSTPCQTVVKPLIGLLRFAGVVAPWAAGIAAFVVLFRRYGVDDIVTWVNLILAFGLAALGTLFHFDRTRGYRYQVTPRKPGTRTRVLD
jgi:hypothetical protein